MTTAVDDLKKETPTSEKPGGDQTAAADPFAEFEQSSFINGAPVEAAPKKEDDDENELVPAEGEEETPLENKEETPPAEKKPNRVPAKERIAQLTKKNADLARQLAAKGTAAAPAPVFTPPVVVKAATDAEKAADPARPQPPKAEDFDLGAIDDAYLDARADWRYAVNVYDAAKASKDAEAARHAEAAASEEAEFRTKLDSQIERGKASADMPDFDEVVVKGAEQGKYPLSQIFGRLMAESDVGAEMAYDLAKNLDLAKEIAALPDHKQAARFGKMEAEKIAAVAAKKEAPKKTPAAPEVPSKQARGAGGSFIPAEDTDDFAAFERMAQQKK